MSQPTAVHSPIAIARQSHHSPSASACVEIQCMHAATYLAIILRYRSHADAAAGAAHLFPPFCFPFPPFCAYLQLVLAGTTLEMAGTYGGNLSQIKIDRSKWREPLHVFPLATKILTQYYSSIIIINNH